MAYLNKFTTTKSMPKNKLNHYGAKKLLVRAMITKRGINVEESNEEDGGKDRKEKVGDVMNQNFIFE